MEMNPLCAKAIQHKGPDELWALGTASLNQQGQITVTSLVSQKEVN